MDRTLSLLLIVVILLSGCAPIKQAKTVFSGWTGGTQETESSSSLSSDEYLMSGKIKSINGNEMELELGTIKTGRQPMRDGENGETASGTQGPSDGGSLPGTEGNGEAAAGRPGGRGSGRTSAGAGGEAGATGFGEMPFGGMEGSGTAGRASGGMGATRSVELEKSGEVKTFLIPVKTPVYASGNTDTVLTFSQLEVGAVITATMRENDNGDDLFVSIQVVG